jgi:hypothetical protein
MKKTPYLAILPALNMFNQIQAELNKTPVDVSEIDHIVKEYNMNNTPNLSCNATRVEVKDTNEWRVFIRFDHDTSFIIEVNQNGWTSIWT